MKQSFEEKHGYTVKMLEGSVVRMGIPAWQALMREDYQKSKDIAFLNTGCEIAYPTWWQDGEQTDCCHLDCVLRRKEHPLSHLPWLARFNAEFRGQLSNWLRFALETPEGRTRVARLYWAMKKTKKFDIMGCVFTGIA